MFTNVFFACCVVSDDPGDVESYLVGDIGASFADITIHLAHDADVLIAVQQRELLVLGAAAATGDGLVGFQTGIGEHHNQTLGVLVMGRNSHMLLGDQLGELGRRTRLGPCRETVRHLEMQSGAGGVRGEVGGLAQQLAQPDFELANLKAKSPPYSLEAMTGVWSPTRSNCGDKMSEHVQTLQGMAGRKPILGHNGDWDLLARFLLPAA